jgi:hypothetical protein
MLGMQSYKVVMVLEFSPVLYLCYGSLEVCNGLLLSEQVKGC